ncbi:hypothetical protein NRF20_29555 [Streptomyces sp. R-74717]|uniref:hypothetical protein n=1 Tax=Streptomyces sp. R-74717 TaxID=2969820 RepID=UPI0039B47330
MKDLVRRFTESLVRLVRPVPAAVHPYSCVYVAGPTARRAGARPPRTLWLAVHGVDVGPRPLRGAEAAA